MGAKSSKPAVPEPHELEWLEKEKRKEEIRPQLELPVPLTRKEEKKENQTVIYIQL